MKSIDLAANALNLDELLRLAAKENILLRTSEGQEFILAGVDDLDQEIEAISHNEELTRLLAERALVRNTRALHHTVEQLKARFGLSSG